MTRFDAARGVDNAAALPTPPPHTLPPQPKRTIHALHEPDNLTRQLHRQIQDVTEALMKHNARMRDIVLAALGSKNR